MCCELKEDVISNVFEEFEDNIGDAEYFKNRILLATTIEFLQMQEYGGTWIPNESQVAHIE